MSQQLMPASSTLPRRFVGLDGLRGILAFCVIIVHVTAQYSPSVLKATHIDILGQAIVVFFVMSGLLIYWPFMNAVLDGRRLPGTWRYAKARLFRVFPAYVVCFLIANFALQAVFVTNAVETLVPDTDRGTGIITDPLRILAHVTLVQNYLPSELQTGISASWTLTAELGFYFLLPIVCFGAAALATKLKVHPIVAAALPGILLIVIGLVSRFIALFWFDASGLTLNESEWGPNLLAVFTRSIFSWADNFGWGMLVGLAVSLFYRRGGVSVAGIPIRTAAWMLVAVGFVGSAASYLLFSRLIGAVFALFAVGLVLLVVIPVKNGVPWRVSRLIDNRVLYWLGTISLSLYVWHYPIMVTLFRLHVLAGDGWLGWVWNVFIVFAVCIAIASLSYRFIELPAIGLLRRKTKKPTRDGGSQQPITPQANEEATSALP